MTTTFVINILEKRKLKFWYLSGEYPAVVSVATVGNLKDPGSQLMGDSFWCRISRELVVVVSLAELLWIKRYIILVSAEICACKGSRLAFILSSTKSGKNLMLFFLLPSVASASTSPITSSSCADIQLGALESNEVPLLSVLNLWEKLTQSARSKL